MLLEQKPLHRFSVPVGMQTRYARFYAKCTAPLEIVGFKINPRHAETCRKS